MNRKNPRASGDIDGEAGRYHQTSPNVVRKRRAPTPTQEFRAQQETRIAPHASLPSLQTTESLLGDDWLWSYWKETLGRNLATAGALALQYAMGWGDAERALAGRTKTRECLHATMSFEKVSVCTKCFTAVDRVV